MNKITTVGITLLATTMLMGLAGCKCEEKAKPEHPEKPGQPAQDPSQAKPLDHPAH